MGGSGDVVMRVEGASKKFCRSLKRLMWYGLTDVSRDTLGMSTHPDRLRRDEFWAVDDVSFDLHGGECLGLVGANGAGKSTLFKMLNGIIGPDRGRIRYSGRMGALIEVGAGFHPQLTGRENIFVNGVILGMSRAEIRRKLDSIISFADVGEFLDTPIKFYSSGMLVRLGMAVAVHTDPKILLVDEVFAVGDMNFQAKCLNRIGEMRRSGTTFIMVSHNIHLVGTFAQNVMVLDRGKVVAYGPTEEALGSYVELMAEKREGQEIRGEDRPIGTGRIRFRDVQPCDGEGRPVERLHATQPLQIVVDYEASIDCDDTNLSITAYDSGNSLFLQVNNDLLNQPLRLKQGRGKLVARFPCMPSNGGKLSFSVALWGFGWQEVFDWRRLPSLRIEGSSRSGGAVWLPCSIEDVGAMGEDATVHLSAEK